MQYIIFIGVLVDAGYSEQYADAQWHSLTDKCKQDANSSALNLLDRLINGTHYLLVNNLL